MLLTGEPVQFDHCLSELKLHNLCCFVSWCYDIVVNCYPDTIFFSVCTIQECSVYQLFIIDKLMFVSGQQSSLCEGACSMGCSHSHCRTYSVKDANEGLPVK